MATVIPPEYICPITCDIMVDPVSDDNGHTYERAAIEEALRKQPNKSPITRSYISNTLRTNYALKSQIERYSASIPDSGVVTMVPFVSKPATLEAQIVQIHGQRHVSITVTPPSTGDRQPIAMIILLDNSGSMGENACDTTETGGIPFSRMDLCKHTIRTLAGMLTDKDTLTLITFSTSARLVMRPTNMSAHGKSKVDAVLQVVRPDSQTNISAALELAHNLAKTPQFNGCNIVTALLTDGLPNVSPPIGEVPAYKELKEKPDTLSTFGFGYALNSNILADLAKEGGGIFGFIPDYSMVSTVFINWAATALATASLSRKVTVTFTDGTNTEFTTGSIQFGQPRHFIFPNERTIVNITMGDQSIVPEAEPVLPTVLALRHDMRVAIQSCIISNGGTAPGCFTTVYSRYVASEDENVQALLLDICDTLEEGARGGQIALAPRYYQKWGKHYLRAYRSALENEQCMNFKDPGLQIFGGSLFKELTAEGVEIFKSIPLMDPTGSTATATATTVIASHGGSAAPPMPSFNASLFHNASGGCFLGYCKVWLADGCTIKIQDLKPGDKVMSFGGTDTVVAVVKCSTKNKFQDICYLGELAITPWHPILVKGEWVFPADIVEPDIYETHSVYNVVLTEDHIMNVGGHWCVTLGHGFKEPVVAHPFFGTQRVIDDLKRCEGWDSGYPSFTNLVAKRDAKGLVCEWYNLD